MLCNFYPYVFSFNWADSQADHLLDQTMDDLSQVPDDSKIILMCYEWLSADAVVDFMTKISERSNKKIIWLLTDSFYDDIQKRRMHQLGQDLRFIEFDILFLHFEINLYRTSVLNKSWNSEAKNFLFLTGKPNRLNRIRLLYKFYKKNLLSHCTWSLFLNEELEKSCRDLLKELTDQEYTDFVRNHQRNPDKIAINFNAGNESNYDGFPFDTELFSQSSFRVIAETMMSHPIISEKTWVTVINQMPFIMTGPAGTLKILKDQGFRTFEKYLPIDWYDSIQDDDQRLDAVITNTEYWLSSINTHKNDIAKDIQFNFELINKKIKDTAEQFDKIYSDLGDIAFEPFRILPMSHRTTWINFYYGIKDPSWPDCWLEKDFATLPLHIQQEMKEIHHYVPKF